MTPYFFIGGSVAFSYQFIFDYLRHHHETNNDRPMFIDHSIACGLIGSVSLGLYFGLPRYWFIGGFTGAFVLSPMIWWAYKHGRMNALGKHPNIFYENSATKEDIERI